MFGIQGVCVFVEFDSYVGFEGLSYFGWGGFWKSWCDQISFYY